MTFERVIVSVTTMMATILVILDVTATLVDLAADVLRQLRGDGQESGPGPEDGVCASIEATIALHRGDREIAAEWFSAAAQASFDDLGVHLSQVTFCVVDLETTGGSAADCAITEIGAVVARVNATYGSEGYEIIPVPVYYPEVTTILGQRVYRRLGDIPGDVDMVNVFRRSQDVPPHLDDILAKRGLGFVPEDRKVDGLVGDFSIAENLMLNRSFRSPFVARSLRAADHSNAPGTAPS